MIELKWEKDNTEEFKEYECYQCCFTLFGIYELFFYVYLSGEAGWRAVFSTIKSGAKGTLFTRTIFSCFSSTKDEIKLLPRKLKDGCLCYQYPTIEAAKLACEEYLYDNLTFKYHEMACEGKVE